MVRKYARLVLVLGCVTMMIVGAGCRSRKKTGTTGGDLDPLGPGGVYDGGLSMGDARTEGGDRVTDVSFDAVLFAYDSYQVAGGEEAKLASVADYMRQNSNVRLEAEGHCDERGSREYNMTLGENRALAVRAYLVGLGIDGSRIQTKSYGEENPVDFGHDENAWRLNRRVEFALYR